LRLSSLEKKNPGAFGTSRQEGISSPNLELLKIKTRRSFVEPKKAKIILNPAANHGETGKLAGKMGELFSGKLDFDLQLTKGPKHAIKIARDLFGYDLVIAVGGDGTAHEVVNGLTLSNNKETALGLLPTGSGNDFRRALGISRNLQEAARQILEGKEKLIDLGMINGVYYANSLGIGFDAKVAHTANKIKDEVKRAGMPLYLTALFRILFTDYRCFNVSIKINASDWIHKTVTVVAINNGLSYGGGFLVTPKALNNDGFLDLCLVDELSPAQIIPRLPFVIAGRHEWMRQVHTQRVKRLVLRSEEELPAHLDGELMTGKNFLVESIPIALKVIVPPTDEEL
jgi:YegS/Rv2252/BmrU family lipid kinase